MLDHIRSEPRIPDAFGERHADGVADALTKRSGGRLDARRVTIFGMPRGLRAQLPEFLDLADIHARRTSQMQQRVEQHRAVTRRQHEPVAIWPRGIGSIVAHHFAEQHGRDIGHAHRHARMTGLRGLHGIHG